MEKCDLTTKQINALVAGEKVKVEWTTLGEYGWIDDNELILIPEKPQTKKTP